MRKISYLVIVLCLSMTLHAQKSYRSNWAKYILADIYLGAPVEFYEKFAREENDANSLRAIRWYKAGERIANIEDFQRIELAKNVIRIVHKGTKQEISGAELLLSGANNFTESNVRIIQASLLLGEELSTYLPRFGEPDVTEALKRRTDNVLVTNLKDMELVWINDSCKVVKKGTKIPVDGKAILLDIDEGFYQEDARYMFADMCLGGPVEFYREILYSWRDPNAGGALQMLDQGVKITNLSIFERISKGDKCDIVYKGTNIRITGKDVKLSTDL
jgi:hypothetical protein